MENTPVGVTGQEHAENVVNGFAGHQPFSQSVTDAGANRRSRDVADLLAADSFEEEDAR
jgi:hypothetical protein